MNLPDRGLIPCQGPWEVLVPRYEAKVDEVVVGQLRQPTDGIVGHADEGGGPDDHRHLGFDPSHPIVWITCISTEAGHSSRTGRRWFQVTSDSRHPVQASQPAPSAVEQFPRCPDPQQPYPRVRKDALSYPKISRIWQITSTFEVIPIGGNLTRGERAARRDAWAKEDGFPTWHEYEGYAEGLQGHEVCGSPKTKEEAPGLPGTGSETTLSPLSGHRNDALQAPWRRFLGRIRQPALPAREARVASSGSLTRSGNGPNSSSRTPTSSRSATGSP